MTKVLKITIILMKINANNNNVVNILSFYSILQLSLQ